MDRCTCTVVHPFQQKVHRKGAQRLDRLFDSAQAIFLRPRLIIKADEPDLLADRQPAVTEFIDYPLGEKIAPGKDIDRPLTAFPNLTDSGPPALPVEIDYEHILICNRLSRLVLRPLESLAAIAEDPAGKGCIEVLFDHNSKSFGGTFC